MLFYHIIELRLSNLFRVKLIAVIHATARRYLGMMTAETFLRPKSMYSRYEGCSGFLISSIKILGEPVWDP